FIIYSPPFGQIGFRLLGESALSGNTTCPAMSKRKLPPLRRFSVDENALAGIFNIWNSFIPSGSVGQQERELQMAAKTGTGYGLILAAMAGIGGANFSEAAAADLAVGAFGGVWEQSLRKCAIEPFQKATGKTVEVVLGAPVQWMNQI